MIVVRGRKSGVRHLHVLQDQDLDTGFGSGSGFGFGSNMGSRICEFMMNLRIAIIDCITNVITRQWLFRYKLIENNFFPFEFRQSIFPLGSNTETTIYQACGKQTAEHLRHHHLNLSIPKLWLIEIFCPPLSGLVTILSLLPIWTTTHGLTREL